MIKIKFSNNSYGYSPINLIRFLTLSLLLLISSICLAQDELNQIVYLIKPTQKATPFLRYLRQWDVSPDSCLTVNIFDGGDHIGFFCKVASNDYVNLMVSSAKSSKQYFGYVEYEGYKIFVFSLKKKFYNFFHNTAHAHKFDFLDSKKRYPNAMDVLSPAVFGTYKYRHGKFINDDR